MQACRGDVSDDLKGSRKETEGLLVLCCCTVKTFDSLNDLRSSCVQLKIISSDDIVDLIPSRIQSEIGHERRCGVPDIIVKGDPFSCLIAS